MKNITVYIDEQADHLARIRAAQMGVSISALVRNYLHSLAGTRSSADKDLETPLERRRRLKKFFEEFDARGRGVSEILPREAIYDRNALR